MFILRYQTPLTGLYLVLLNMTTQFNSTMKIAMGVESSSKEYMNLTKIDHTDVACNA